MGRYIAKNIVAAGCEIAEVQLAYAIRRREPVQRDRSTERTARCPSDQIGPTSSRSSFFFFFPLTPKGIIKHTGPALKPI